MNINQISQSLLESFATVPDPRSRFGRRHPLGAILTLSVCAMLSGAKSIYAIWQWGREQEPERVKAMGFTKEKTPAVSSIHEIFKRLDVDAFERAMAAWAQSYIGAPEAIAVDGKALRGIHGEELPGVHLVAAYAHNLDIVLGQSGGKGVQESARVEAGS